MRLLMQKSGLKLMNIKMLDGFMKYLFSILCLSSQLTFSQNAPFAAWTTVVLNLKINDHWTSVTDGGLRTVSSDFVPYQKFFRTGMRYNLDKRWNVAGGFAFFNTKTSFLKENHEYGHEFRLFQEVSRLSLRSRKAIINHRLRIEERFFDETSIRVPFNAMRFQYRFLAGWQFNSKLNFQTGPEIFENLSHRKFSFDQLRWYSILSILPGSGVGISIGYFYVHRKAYNQNIFAITFSKSLQLYEHHQR